MVVRTAKEIVKQAKFLSQSDNSDFLDFFVANNLLNSLYQRVYEDIITHTQTYLKTIEFSGELTLPCDCYAINSITTSGGKVIDRTPKAQNIPGCYSIENQVLKILGSNGVETYILKYFTMPATITCPDDPEEIVFEHPVDTVVMLNEAIAYYKDTEGKYWKHDIEAKEEEAVLSTGEITAPCTYFDKEVVWTENSVMVGEDDITDCIMREGLTIKNIVSDSHCMFITYSDDSIYLYDHYNLLEWNIFAYKGRKAKGEVVAIYIDDSTGKGIIYKDTNGKYFFCSFVPDTVLDFPANIYYEVIEVRLALLMSSLLGMNNEYLNSVYSEKIEQQFYDTLGKDDYSPNRIRNVNESYSIGR